jgi:hypothetical protein
MNKIQIHASEDQTGTQVANIIEIHATAFQQEFIDTCVRQGIIEPLEETLKVVIKQYYSRPFELLRMVKNNSSNGSTPRKYGKAAKKAPAKKAASKRAKKGQTEETTPSNPVLE